VLIVEASMKKSLFFLLMIALMVPCVAGMPATLENTDSQSYELQILEAGRPYSSLYRVIENAKVEICFYGCAMTLLSTGQTVTVNPKDSVVIDNGVMNVTSGD
jgi:hypothetical protein